MHNAYFSSTLVSFKNRGSVSFSFNDYSSLLNEKFDRIPSSSCCSCCCTCCSCCEYSPAHSTRVSINTSYLYGLRQSTLIQCPPYKRLIFAGKDRLFSRFPVCDLDRGCYENGLSIRKRSCLEGFDRRRRGRFSCLVSEEKSERNWLGGGVEDAEAVISLLSEEVSEEYLGGRERNKMLAKSEDLSGEFYRGRKKKVEIETRGNCGGEYSSGRKKNVVSNLLESDSKCEFESVRRESREVNQRLAKNEDLSGEFGRGRKKKVEVDKRGNYGGEYSRGRKKNVVSNLLESDSKCEFELARMETREDGYRRNEGREAIDRRDKHKERTKSSSCSSYYSLSSVGEYESDGEVQDKEEQFVEESFGGYRKDSRSEEDSYKALVVDEFNEVDGHEAMEQRSSAAGSHVEWDCRKKSEKKLNEVAAEEAKSIKQSSQIHWRIDGTGKTDYGKASTSLKQFNDVEEESVSAVNLDKDTRKLCSQTNIQDTKQSRRKWQEITKMEEMHGIDVETTSESQKLFDSKEEILTKGEHRQTVGLITGNNDSSDSQQHTRTSQIMNVDSEKVTNLHRHSGSRVKVEQKDETLVQSSVQQTKGQHQQRNDRISGQIDLRREPEYLSESLESHGTNLKGSSTIQSETRMKNLEENSRFQYLQKDHKHHQRTQSWKGSHDVMRVSVLSASDMERHKESLRTSENRVNQESTLTSVVKPMGEIRYRYNPADEKAVQTKLRKGAQRPTRVSNSHDDYSEESCSLQASLNLVSQARMQETNVEEQEEEERISQTNLMPPPPQLLARSSQLVGSTNEFLVQEISSKSSENDSSALHAHSGFRTPYLHSDSYVRDGHDEACEEPLNLDAHGDALGSAQRLEESSTQFVGEFVEKARHDVSTSELARENIAVPEVVYDGEKQFEENPGQYGSKDLPLKGREPRQSPEGSGGKGPSDDMWDVTDLFVQPQGEAPEDNQAASNAIVKKRGRSLWNIMGDIVRLRWGSHAETSSAAKSNERSPSNFSVSSETWFSGRESDKNSDENIKRVGSKLPKDAIPLHQQPRERTSAHSQVEISDTMKSKSEEHKLEVDMPSSSNIIEDGSTSKRMSSNFEEKNLNQKEDVHSSRRTSSGPEVLTSSSQLGAGSSRHPPPVEVISGPGKTYASESGPMIQPPHSFNSMLYEVSGSSTKDGDLKQKKLQRNKQVLKDRFDEWEEAYKLEIEQREIDEMFMREALLEANKAADTWEVPVGAVLVQHGKIIARGCNLVEGLRDSTAHAEMICIREASNVLRTWRLADTTLYVTLEPCPMCAGAILQARVSTLVWGAPNKLLGADGSWIRLFPDGGEKRDGSDPSDKPAAPVHPFHPKMIIRRGVLAAECAGVMRQFFQLRRRKEKNEDAPPPPPRLSIANQQPKILRKMQHIFHMFCL